MVYNVYIVRTFWTIKEKVKNRQIIFASISASNLYVNRKTCKIEHLCSLKTVKELYSCLVILYSPIIFTTHFENNHAICFEGGLNVIQ